MFTYVTHVSVNVLDVNDHVPQFMASNTVFFVVENQTLPVLDKKQINSVKVGQLYAYDLDSDSFGLVQYMLSSENSEHVKHLFEVDKSTGIISLLRPDEIDREKNATIELIVECYDNLGDESNTLNSSTTITILVQDINDNAPDFIEPAQYDYDVKENDLTFEVKLTAHDLDFGQNATLMYALDKLLNDVDVQQKFMINSMTGLLQLAAPLDYETKVIFYIKFFKPSKIASKYD